MDVVRNFPDRVARRPERYAMPAGKSAAQVQAELQAVLASELAARKFAYPRSDGSSSDPAAIREGTRLRLDPSVDVDALRLTPLAKAIAKAAQTYGFIVTDRGGAVAVMAEGVDVHRERTGEDPWAQMLSGVPSYEQLKGFPWERTQVIRRDWGRPG